MCVVTQMVCATPSHISRTTNALKQCPEGIDAQARQSPFHSLWHKTTNANTISTTLIQF